MQDKYSQNTFYLVRHGEAENNVLRILDAETGKPEYHLTPRGMEQVKETAEYLTWYSVDFIVSSPILRAQETAEILREGLKVALSFDKRLTEALVGNFENKNLDLFLDYMKEHGGRLAGLMKEGIEGYTDIRERSQSFLADVSTHFEGKNIIIVSHGDILQEIYGELLRFSVGLSQGDESWYPKYGSCMLIAKDKTEEYVPES